MTVIAGNLRPGFAILVGNCAVRGTVSRLGVVGRYRVRLYERVTGIVIGEVLSETDGSYQFVGLPKGQFYVVAFDNTGSPVNAAISDYVTPEPMA